MSTLLRIFSTTLAGLAVLFVLAGISITTNAQSLDTPVEQTEYSCTNNQSTQDCVDNNPIVKWLQFFINVLSVVILAGSAVMVAVAGIQYTASRDNPQAVQAAKQKMYNIVLGLGIYFFLYAFVQWLVPGGVF
jgi:flagellar biosynthesis protein FlhB